MRPQETTVLVGERQPAWSLVQPAVSQPRAIAISALELVRRSLRRVPGTTPRCRGRVNRRSSFLYSPHARTFRAAENGYLGVLPESPTKPAENIHPIPA